MSPPATPTPGHAGDALAGRPILALIPNGLSVVRLVLGLAFPWLPVDWRFGVVLAAAISDMFDGLSARLLHAASATGRLLDPIADKVFVGMLAITLLIDGWISPWLAILVGLRDLTVLSGAVWVVLRRDHSHFKRMKPTLLGKLATAGQFVFLAAVVYMQGSVPEVAVPVVIISALAAADYIWLFCSAEPKPTSTIRM